MSILSKATAFKSPATKTKAKKVGVEIEIEGLEDYALVDALLKTLEAVKDSYAENVKNQAREHFLEAAENGKRPENFRGLDGCAEASIELRKRSTRSVLSDDEVAILEAANVPYDTIEDVSEAFVINPKYLGDSALLARIEKVKGLPEDFIQKQEKVSRRAVSDDTLTKIFANGLAGELFDLVTTLAIKAKLNTPEDAKTLALVKKLLGAK